MALFIVIACPIAISVLIALMLSIVIPVARHYRANPR